MSNADQHLKSKLFRFKKFSLTDVNCAMKIGTDGVLLGSVAGRYAASEILDIGTGCGLIALMIAQKSSGNIVAIDQDEDSIATAAYNLSISPWKERINVLKSRFQDYWPQISHKFDLIVCNPPFFHNSLKNPCNKKALARHSDLLAPGDLMQGISYLLAEPGVFLVIVPYQQEYLWLETASDYNLGCARRIEVSPRLGMPPHRMIMQFVMGNATPITERLAIEDAGRHKYSQDYRELTEEYYLNF